MLIARRRRPMLLEHASAEVLRLRRALGTDRWVDTTTTRFTDLGLPPVYRA